MSRIYKKNGNLTEAAEQELIFRYASYKPELKFMFAIPNGGSRNRLEAANMKRQGVRRGVPDIFVPVARGGYHGLFIELKTKGGRLSDEQREYIDYLNQEGYKAVVCVGANEVFKCLDEYLELK